MIQKEDLVNERVAEIEQLLGDYSWMIKEIKRLRPLLGEVEDNQVSQFSVKGILPKPQGMANNPISNETVRGNKRHKRLTDLEDNVLFIQNRMHAITGDREIAILGCLLDGMSISSVSRHMGLSRTHIHRIRREMAYAIEKCDGGQVDQD